MQFLSSSWSYFIQFQQTDTCIPSLDTNEVTAPTERIFHWFHNKSHSKKEYDSLLNVVSQTLTLEPVAAFH